MPPPELAAQIIAQAQKSVKEGGEGLPVTPAPISGGAHGGSAVMATSTGMADSSSISSASAPPSAIGSTLTSPTLASSTPASSTQATAQINAPQSVPVSEPAQDIQSLAELARSPAKIEDKIKIRY